MASIRQLRRELKVLRRRVLESRLNHLAAVARSDYAQWRQEQFECGLASLILRIGKYGPNPPKHRVEVSEVQEFLRKFCNYDATTEECIEWMHRRMSA